MKRFVKYAYVVIFLFSCDVPTKSTTNMENVFDLSIHHDIVRITGKGTINLKWDPMSVENFSHFRIERKLFNDSVWKFIKDSANPMLTEFEDKIEDDEDLSYRVGIMDSEMNVLWSEKNVMIPKTKFIHVPDEILTPSEAFSSPLIDDKDTIVVKSGLYENELSMIGKTVYVRSFSEQDLPVFSSRIIINEGTLDGFIIKDVKSDYFNGGGIYLSGNGIVKNCIIKNNTSGRNGGGVFIKEEGSLYNSILFNNQSSLEGSNIFIQKSNGKIINNTFVLFGDLSFGKNVSVSELKDGFLFLNNIIAGGKNFASDSLSRIVAKVDYSMLEESTIWGENNISGNPLFMSITSENFHLLPESPCINSGHPDKKYFNQNGSRNTMGAYGGPDPLK